MTQKPVYILDTNVLLYDPESIFEFSDGVVGIPVEVLEELDKLKTDSTQRGYHCREVIRYLDALRTEGSLKDGVQLQNGGKLRIIFETHEAERRFMPFKDVTVDNDIILSAFDLQQKGHTVIFVSKDINARIKADVLGIETIDYTKESIPKEEVYKGWRVLPVPAVQLKKDFPEELKELADTGILLLNEFVILESHNNPFNYRLFRYLGKGKFKAVDDVPLKWSLKPKNVHQLMALDLLMDPDIQLISLIGTAGTGKTFLALLAGLHQVLIQHTYEKMLISRPVIPLGPDIGYLPGDMQEKLFSWMQPVYDNMEFIIHFANTGYMGVHKEEMEKESRYQDTKYHDTKYHDTKYYKNKKNQRHKKLITQFIPSLNELIRDRRISLEAITYMRGRSIPYQFIIIDEVQNLTPHEVKTLITRVGEGSKIILAGDPQQIDSPYLDARSNGLVVATEKFKGQALFGLVHLEISERSALSRIAGELL